MGALEALTLMLALCPTTTDRPLRVLALGAHADDIEIGAGASMLRWQRERSVEIRALVFSATVERRREAEHSAQLLYGNASSWSLDVHDFAENLFPDQVEALKATIAELRSFEPDLVITHRLIDRHQDHRTIAEITWQAFRDHTILQYEIPKWEGDLTTPNLYVPIEQEDLDRKLGILVEAYRSQAGKPWFDAEAFRGLARLRGVECGVRWAEGFHADKLVLALASR